MKYVSVFCLFLVFSLKGYSQTVHTFHEYSVVTIQGDTISLSKYAGKKLLVVNTASYCGYTWQYENLQALNDQYGGDHFAVIGFPCNDFSSQEPGTDSTINQFCTDIYGVTFQMMSKIHTITGDTSPVYKWLQRENLNGVANAHVQWNFNKFLVDEAGHWVRHFTEQTVPNDTAIVNWILKPSIYTGVPSVPNKIASTSLVNDLLTVSFNDAVGTTNVKLFSVNGVQVADIYNGNDEGQTITYNTGAISAGLYLLQINATSGSKVIKLAVLH